MNYFKINANFKDFFSYLKANSEPSIRHQLCIMHHEDETIEEFYLATENPEVVQLIEGHYQPEKLSDSPMRLVENANAFLYRGNKSLME